MLEVNDLNKDTVKKTEAEEDDATSSPKSAKESDDSSISKTKEERQFGDILSDSQITKKMKKFGRISKKCDGKILEDEEDEVVEIKKETYVKLGSYYGDWFILLLINVIQISLSYNQFQKDLLIGNWGSMTAEEQ